MTDLDASIVSPAAQPVRRPVLSWLGKVFGDSFGVLGLAGKVLVQHWPVLLVLALAGEIARARLVLWAAEVSYQYGELGFLILGLAPLSVLAAAVLMLLRAKASLPALAAVRLTRGRLVQDIAVVLVPFLVYYSASGRLSADFQDVKEFVLLFGVVDAVNLTGSAFVGWAGISVLLGTTAVIAVLRWIVRRWSFAQRHPLVGLPSAYLEALWLMALVWLVMRGALAAASQWTQQRRAWVATADWLHGDFEAAGWFAGPARTAAGWLLEVWGVVDSALVVPIAALTAGIVVFGIRTEAPRVVSRHRRSDSMLGHFVRSLVAIPRDAVWSRIEPAVSGLRLMVRAGLVPMLVFSLAYVAVTQILSGWLWALERRIIGPADFATVSLPLNRILVIFNAAVVLMLVTCLVAGALGRVAATIGHATSGQAEVDGSTREKPNVGRQHAFQDDPDGDGLGTGRQQEVRGAGER